MQEMEANVHKILKDPIQEHIQGIKKQAAVTRDILPHDGYHILSEIGGNARKCAH